MNATLNVYQYTTTFFMTSLVMSLKPDVTSKPISDSDKLSRKRKSVLVLHLVFTIWSLEGKEVLYLFVPSRLRSQDSEPLCV